MKLALTHRSYLHVTGQRDSNERLEFLGDSVLGLVTSETLYRAHPTEHEGQLTKTKSLLVSKAILSRRALAMGLGRFVLMSHSEVESGGRQRLSILADAFESVVGAIYLDQGFEAARGFIERWLLRDTRTIVADKRHTNYKSHLQEYVQSTYRTHPVYRIRSEMGPDHSKQFTVEVIVGRRMLGQGKGRNKKEAEQAAARDALEQVERGPTSDRGRDEEARRPGAEPEERTRRTPARPPASVQTRDEEEEEEEEGPQDTAHATGEEGEAASRRRRRGRRGGRGRRRPESPEARPAAARPAAGTGESASPMTPRASQPPPPPRSEPVRPRPAPGNDRSPDAEVVLRAAEIEPLPPAREEDDLEDVGRPDLPFGEEVEPAWFAPFRSAPEAPKDERGGSVEAVDVAPETQAGGMETHDEAEETHSPWIEPGPEGEREPPAPPPAPGSTVPPVQYGRRSSRGRRPG